MFWTGRACENRYVLFLQCVPGYGCSHCDVALNDDGSALRRMAGGGNATMDLCSIRYGGAVCRDDYDCDAGFCVSGRCKCSLGELGTSRLLSAWLCGVYGRA